MIIDDTSWKDYFQSEEAYERKRDRMKKLRRGVNKVKKQTLDTIVTSGQMIKSDYYYAKNYYVPQQLDNMYIKTYKTIGKIYDTAKYLTEFIYNIILKK